VWGERSVGRQTKQFVRNKPSSKQGRKLGREGCGEGFWGAWSGSDGLAPMLLANECLVLRH
jgi:hypothetical protein